MHSHCVVSALPCPSSTHEESCHMFQQVPVTRAPCSEALALTGSPLESRGGLTCKQPCQGKTLKSLVGESAMEPHLHRDPWRTLSNSQWEKSIRRGLQPEPGRANRIGHRAVAGTFSTGGGRSAWTGRGRREHWGGGLKSPAEPCVLLLGYVTGAGAWVGGLLSLGEGRSEADFLSRRRGGGGGGGQGPGGSRHTTGSVGEI